MLAVQLPTHLSIVSLPWDKVKEFNAELMKRIEEDRMAQAPQARAGLSMTAILGIGLRLWRHRNQAIALVQQAQELIAVIMGPASAAPAHAFDVKWVQSALNKVSGAKLDLDGDYGDKTKAAVKKYQQDKGLEADGWVGVVTLSELEQDMIEISA